jgi:hypothetical protein
MYIEMEKIICFFSKISPKLKITFFDEKQFFAISYRIDPTFPILGFVTESYIGFA